MPPETEYRGSSSPTKSVSIPVAIILAGVLIAGAIYLVNRPATPTTSGTGTPRTSESVNIKPVSTSDHILGNPSARIVIVEYSDLECPFCKQFHATMHAIINEFGKGGDVAWVFRNAPIPQLHPKSPHEHEAAECVAELGGNDKYWQYIDKIYEVTPSNNGLDPALLPQIAAEIGIDSTKFQTCLASNKFAQKITGQFNEGLAAATILLGPNQFGTPFSIAVIGNQKLPIEGAQPLAALRAEIQQILSAQKATQ